MNITCFLVCLCLRYNVNLVNKDTDGDWSEKQSVIKGVYPAKQTKNSNNMFEYVYIWEPEGQIIIIYNVLLHKQRIF